MALKTKPLDKVRPDVPTAAAAQGEPVRVNLNVSEATRTAWKMMALQRGMTLGDMIVEAVNLYSKK